MARPRIEALADIESAIWQELTRAPRDKHHAWRTPVLATVRTDAEGLAADARTVVLREVDRDRRSLLLYTDARSPKVAQVSQHPRGTLVLWSRDLGWQLRLGVDLSLETDGLALSSRWARLKFSPAAQDYMAPLPPGAPQPDMAPPPAPGAESRAHFAVLTAQVDSLDWLELHPLGHRRAAFNSGQAPCWLVP